MSQVPVAAPAEVVLANVRCALQEDVGAGDVSAALLPSTVRRASLVTREAGILAGCAWFEACFLSLDPGARFQWQARDGESMVPNMILCTITAMSSALVTAERSALNFLQLLSATATQTRRFVDAVAGTTATILDTRKTIPGLRQAQKYAVRCGGAKNHRIGLFDAVMIKENHILACGSIAAAVQQARSLSPGIPVIVEVETLAELAEALDSKPERILLDEFGSNDMREAVRLAAGRCDLEASGGVDLQTVRAIAETGVQFISVGSITKNVRAIDLSLRLLPE